MERVRWYFTFVGVLMSAAAMVHPVAAAPVDVCTSLDQNGFCVGHATLPDGGGTTPSDIFLGQAHVPTAVELDLAAGGGSASLIVQTGNNNIAYTTIINSPGTVVSQFQIGNLNFSEVFVQGGSLNRVNVKQNGNSYKSDIYLLNSTRTTINNDQSGSSNQVKKLIVLNAEPGTVINML